MQLIAADVHAMADSLGDPIGSALTGADAEPKRKLYDELRLEMTYNPDDKIVAQRNDVSLVRP